jgi:hypothetical protein
MPKTITKRCAQCRAPLRFSRKQFKADRMEMRRRDGIKRAGTPTCKHCFDCGPAFVA